jgi:hypothetical protein
MDGAWRQAPVKGMTGEGFHRSLAVRAVPALAGLLALAYALTATLNWRVDVTSFGTVRSEEAAARLARVREGSARQAAFDQRG